MTKVENRCSKGLDLLVKGLRGAMCILEFPSQQIRISLLLSASKALPPAPGEGGQQNTRPRGGRLSTLAESLSYFGTWGNDTEDWQQQKEGGGKNVPNWLCTNIIYSRLSNSCLLTCMYTYMYWSKIRWKSKTEAVSIHLFILFPKYKIKKRKKVFRIRSMVFMWLVFLMSVGKLHSTVLRVILVVWEHGKLSHVNFCWPLLC